MLKNNNEAVITRMAKRSFRSNKRRNLTMTAAVFLSAFLLFSVFTVGATYFKMQRIQNIRLNGADFDAIMYGVTEQQYQKCENNPDITAIGLIGIAGSVAETEYDSTPNVGLLWANDTYWTDMMEPAREWMEGAYPKEADEVMVTKAALKECGLENLKTGDSFSMTYRAGEREETKEFRISGMWDGFGDKKVFFVSGLFYEQTGNSIEDVASGRCYLDFKQRVMTEKKQNAFIESMDLNKNQNLFFMASYRESVNLFGGMAGLVLITCFSAYLLIYNIMYLSVSDNVRYYGLLQTIGMTEKQIYHLIQRQMFLVSGIGMTGGMLLGGGVSFFLIPAAVKALGIQNGKISVAFHPGIFLFTILLTGVTVWIAGRKPAKMAVSISPIEALGYRAAIRKGKVKKSRKGKLLPGMARMQLTKDKKKTGIVILSLAASMSVFLCLVTLMESQGARTLVSNFMDMDMVITNDTMKKEDRENWEQLLDGEFLEKIKGIEGVAEVHPMLRTEIVIPWEPEFMDVWMREFYEKWMNIPYEEDIGEYKESPENFGTFLVGIDDAEFSYLNETLENPVEEDAFFRGETCLLYGNNLELKDSMWKGKQITCALYEERENSRTFSIAGLTNDNYFAAGLLGIPPTILVSDRVVKEMTADPLVYQASVGYDKAFDEKAEAELCSLMEGSPYQKNFSYDSKIEEMEYVKKAQGNMMEIGIGIVLILAFIGIMNYANTMIGSIQTRKTEISVMESIGMTEKQVKKLLAMEGLWFAGLSLLVTFTAGLGVTYYLYQSMNYMGVPFRIPLLPVAAAVLFVGLVCVFVPLCAYRNLEKSGTLTERIRFPE